MLKCLFASAFYVHGSDKLLVIFSSKKVEIVHETVVCVFAYLYLYYTIKAIANNTELELDWQLQQ